MKQTSLHNQSTDQEKNQPALKNENLPSHVLKGIEKSLNQFENGQSISFEEFKLKHSLK